MASINMTEDLIKKMNDAKMNLYSMFHGKVEKEIIDMVLNSCDYDENSAYEHLLVMAGDMLDAPQVHSTAPLLLSQEQQIPSNAQRAVHNTQTMRSKPIIINHDQPTNLFEQLSATSPNTNSNYMLPASELLASDPSVVLAVQSQKPFQNNLFPSNNDFIMNPLHLNEPVLRDCVSPIESFSNMTSTLTQSSERKYKASDECESLPSKDTSESWLKQKLNDPSKLFLILMRGLPGSGKSHKAKQLSGIRAIIFSTDDFFSKDGRYQFDLTLLSEAHKWNQERARNALKYKLSPIFIDNTNTQAWEMKPYANMALQYHYELVVLEPDTHWAWKPSVLARKNSHQVAKESIERMLSRYEQNISVSDLIKMIRPNHIPTDIEGKEQEMSARHVQMKSVPVNQRRCPKLRNSPSGSPRNTRHIFHSTPSKPTNSELINQEDCTQTSKIDKECKNDVEIASVVDRNTENISCKALTENLTHIEHSLNITDLTHDVGLKVGSNYSIQKLSKNDSRKKFLKNNDGLEESDTFTNLPSLARMSDSLESASTRSSDSNLVGKQNSQGRIGDIVNSYKTWSNEHVKILYDSESRKNMAVDFVATIDVDMHDLTHKSEQLKVQSNEGVNEFGLQFLSECFPDFSTFYLKNWLKRYNGDLLKTCDYLSRLSQVEELPDDVNDVDDVIAINDDDIDDKEDDGNVAILKAQSSKNLQPFGEVFFCDDEKSQPSKLRIAIDKKLGTELVKKYGKNSDPPDILTCDDYVFDMDEDIGKKMYSSWIAHIKAKKRTIDTMLSDDAEFARRLQEEENKILVDKLDGRGKSKKKKMAPLPIDTEFSSTSKLKGGIFSPTSPWKNLEQEESSTPTIKDSRGCTLTVKQLKIRNELYSQFPGLDEQDLNQVLEASSYNIDAATSLVNDSCGLTNKTIKNVHAAEASNQWQVVASPPRKKLVATSSAVNIQQSGTSSVISVSPDYDDHRSIYQNMNEETQDYADFRAEANLHKNLRAECFQKAAKAFQEKKGEVAQYYADKAHQHTMKMKEAHARAAELTLERRNKQYMKKQQVIDLHGLHADEALRAVKNFIENAYNVGHREIYVITGRGLHSKNGISAVRSAVLHCLDQHRLRTELQKNGGMVKVYLRS